MALLKFTKDEFYFSMKKFVRNSAELHSFGQFYLTQYSKFTFWLL